MQPTLCMRCPPAMSGLALLVCNRAVMSAHQHMRPDNYKPALPVAKVHKRAVTQELLLYDGPYLHTAYGKLQQHGHTTLTGAPASAQHNALITSRHTHQLPHTNQAPYICHQLTQLLPELPCCCSHVIAACCGVPTAR
jgi:hypothetical protein